MSIVDPKYRDKREKDWLAAFVDGEVLVAEPKLGKDENGEETILGLKKPRLDLPALFDLARVNNLNVDKFVTQVDQPGAPGRLRMTIGNMLRAAARQRGGLRYRNGAWADAPEGFCLLAPTHDQNGAKLVKAAPAEAA